MARENISKYLVRGCFQFNHLRDKESRNGLKHNIPLLEYSYGQIYPALNELEDEGLATKEVFNPDKIPGTT